MLMQVGQIFRSVVDDNCLAKRSGGVIEVLFPNILTNEEMGLIHEQDQKLVELCPGDQTPLLAKD